MIRMKQTWSFYFESPFILFGVSYNINPHARYSRKICPYNCNMYDR